MGYSTVNIDKKSALHLVKTKKCTVDSASDVLLFTEWPRLNHIVSACKSDHGHIILNLKAGRFVDYKIA